MQGKMLGWLAAGLLAGPLAAQATVVSSGNREWRQPSDTLGFSWDEVATVCDSGTGECSGSLGGVSFDGWTWAAIPDLLDLLEALIQPGVTNFPPGTSLYLAVNDPDIAAILGGTGFEPTLLFEDQGAAVYGMLRESGDDALRVLGAIGDIFDVESADLAGIAELEVEEANRGLVGVWLYRPRAALSSPGTALLLGGGLVGLLGLSRRRRGNAAC